jgi:hypothetical protein
MPRLPAERPHIGLLLRGVRNPAYAEPGFFVLRQAKNGPLVAAIIWRPCPMVIPEPSEEFTETPEYWCYPTEVASSPSQVWSCTPELPPQLIDQGPTTWQGLRARIGDDEADPLEVWARGRVDPLVVARRLAPDKAYQYRMARREWAVTYAPAEPEANPRAAADLSKLPSLF